MDLFCGTGSIGLTLARHCHHVYGFEVASSSIADARRNAAINNISNVTFVQSNLIKASDNIQKCVPKPDVIVTGKQGCDTVVTVLCIQLLHADHACMTVLLCNMRWVSVRQRLECSTNEYSGCGPSVVPVSPNGLWPVFAYKKTSAAPARTGICCFWVWLAGLSVPEAASIGATI